MSDATKSVDLFKTIAWEGLVKLGLSKLFAAIPWLGWGPIGMIVTWIVMKYADQLYEALSLFVNVESIALRNGEFKDMYDRASVTLKVVARNHGIESPEFRKARDENKKRLSDFANYNVVRP